MLPQFIVAVLLSQAQPVKIVNPLNQSKAATTTTSGAKEALDVNCVSGCSAAGGGGGSSSATGTLDGGNARDQGLSRDGGVDWASQAKVWDGVDSLDITAAGAAKVDGSGVTQPISAAALPLPAGASTEATLGTLLASGTFTARLGTLGQKTMAGSTPVVFASDQTALPVTGTFWQGTQPVSGPLTDSQLRALAVAISASSLPLPTGAATETTLGTLLLNSTFTARLGTLGQKAMSGSTPVVFASDQSALPITAAALPLPSGAATEATLLTRTKPADQQHAIIDSSALPTGAATETTLGLVKAKTDNIDVLLSTRTKPADQQHAIVDSSALPTGAATDGVLTGGTQKAIMRGGAKGATTAADVTSTSIDADHNAADVSVKGTAAISAVALPLPSGASTSAAQTDRSQKTQITDGTRDGTVKAASTAAQAADTSLVVALHPTSPLPTGSNVIGHVVADTGSTTAVTGNVTVVQPTGTNLHAVLDTTSTTAVTQATGTNLHAVIDTGSTTAATQATASNLNAQVQGPGASGAAKSGNPVQIGGVFNTTQPTVTNGQGIEAQATARGALIIASGVDAVAVNNTQQGTASQNVAQFGGNAVVTGTGVGGVGVPRVTISSDSSITANAGTNLNTSALALSATQTDRTQKSQITDGTRDGTLKAASTAAVAADTSLVVALSPNSPLPTGSNVIGGTSNTTVASANVEGLGVSVTGSSGTCLASNASRQGCSLCLDVDATANIHVRFSSSAATVSYQKLSPGQCAYCGAGQRVYTGAVTCISASGTQTLYPVEVN